MEDYIIIGWPEVQCIMDEVDFDKYSTLINQNDIIGIGSSCYLIDKEWYNSINKNA